LDVDFAETGLAGLELGPGGAINLLLRCLRGQDGARSACLSSMAPTETTTYEATWDVPDLIWVAGALPAHRVGVGLLLAVLASVLPTTLYVGALYWLDRYEKEPGLLLTAAFLWGSIPALALALVGEILFRLPPDLIPSGALEAAQMGLIAPMLQEAVKGVAVLFIALRYWCEIDNVLDGIIYGAVVGFGFAMTGNLIELISAFALWGFDGLTAGAFVEGLLYGLNHAFYTGIFGAGLGIARLARTPWRRWAWPSAGFVLAVAVHALHNLLSWSILGVGVVTVVTTGAGLALIGLVAGWSLRRQRRALQLELEDELSQPLCRTLLVPGGRARARWQALRVDGLAGWRRTRRLHQRCAELAFKKMQLRRRPDVSDLREEIERLRAEVDALSAEG
jgi:RsiW-degrading membrane proteinase PrsW (M82 family)